MTQSRVLAVVSSCSPLEQAAAVADCMIVIRGHGYGSSRNNITVLSFKMYNSI